ncbi:MAG TPA: pantetheine-phosphate adenylyltransferase [Gammaproteobacteria bacterium]|nr:pantetheine-phosphate adenylyltransferase [Gammaproteobacteria bacterium]
MSRSIAIYPGTFDPMTHGHVDIVARAVKIFEHLIIAVAPTTRKVPFLNVDERTALMREVLAPFKNVRVVILEGLLVNFAQRHDAKIIIRGLRSVADFDYELQLARMNQRMMSTIETVFLPTSEMTSAISATMIREIIELGGDITPFVPPTVSQYLLAKKKKH